MLNINHKLSGLIIFLIGLFNLSSCSSDNFSTNPVRNDQNTVNIAVLLPLTGRDGAVARQYEEMIKLGIADAPKTRINLTSYDCSTEELLQSSLDEIINRNIKIIIGPIFSDDTKKVIEKLRGREIIIISLSNNPVLAEKEVFIFGHAPMRQLEQITDYLLQHKYKNFLTILPANYHSQSLAKILKEMIITQKGNLEGNLVKNEFYHNSPEDIAAAVEIISEYVDNLNEVDTNLTKPVILIADEGTRLVHLFDNIREHNLDKKAVIAGDSRINIPLTEEVDFIYTGSLAAVNSDIKERAKKVGITHLSFMHALAYDAGKIVATAAGVHYSKNNFLEKLNSTASFKGLSGNIHFIDSIATRTYQIISRQNGKEEIKHYGTVNKIDYRVWQ